MQKASQGANLPDSRTLPGDDSENLFNPIDKCALALDWEIDNH